MSSKSLNTLLSTSPCLSSWNSSRTPSPPIAPRRSSSSLRVSATPTSWSQTSRSWNSGSWTSSSPLRRESVKYSPSSLCNSNPSQLSSLPSARRNSLRKRKQRTTNQLQEKAKMGKDKRKQLLQKKAKTASQRRSPSTHPNTSGPSPTDSPRTCHSFSETTRAATATLRRDKLTASAQLPKKRPSPRLWTSSASA